MKPRFRAIVIRVSPLLGSHLDDLAQGDDARLASVEELLLVGGDDIRDLGLREDLAGGLPGGLVFILERDDDVVVEVGLAAGENNSRRGRVTWRVVLVVACRRGTMDVSLRVQLGEVLRAHETAEKVQMGVCVVVSELLWRGAGFAGEEDEERVRHGVLFGWNRRYDVRRRKLDGREVSMVLRMIGIVNKSFVRIQYGGKTMLL